ncbi:MAG: arginase family protein [Planctomycetota bacterium]|nr:arginase family protein [Planctomycetota bacterium]
MASRIVTGDPTGCRVGLLGLADDLGVRLNNGRRGAAGGPGAFRTALSRYGVAEPSGWEWPGVFDAGDVEPAPGEDEDALRATHARVEEAARALLGAGLLPVGVGGGHDLTLPLARATIEHERRAGRTLDEGVYFDAHLDVRERVGSGMAFRRLISECGVRRLSIVGMDAFANERAHVEWFRAHGGRETTAGDVLPRGAAFVSVDMDVFGAGEAPGVSAINPCGAATAEVLGAVRALGASGRVRCFDIMELNPTLDVDGRTARLAARVFLEFLRGVAGCA